MESVPEDLEILVVRGEPSDTSEQSEGPFLAAIPATVAGFENLEARGSGLLRRLDAPDRDILEGLDVPSLLAGVARLERLPSTGRGQRAQGGLTLGRPGRAAQALLPDPLHDGPASGLPVHPTAHEQRTVIHQGPGHGGAGRPIVDSEGQIGESGDAGRRIRLQRHLPQHLHVDSVRGRADPLGDGFDLAAGPHALVVARTGRRVHRTQGVGDPGGRDPLLLAPGEDQSDPTLFLSRDHAEGKTVTVPPRDLGSRCRHLTASEAALRVLERFR
jgi:hypothetical protein